jgi:hypothetical protein
MSANNLDELARRAAAGDQTAEKELWIAASAFVYQSFPRFMQNGSAASVDGSLADEALERAAEAFRRFDPESGSFEHILREAALATSQDHARAARLEELREAMGPEYVAKMLQEIEPTPLTPEIRDWLEQHEMTEEEIAASIREIEVTGSMGIGDIIREFEQK